METQAAAAKKKFLFRFFGHKWNGGRKEGISTLSASSAAVASAQQMCCSIHESGEWETSSPFGLKMSFLLAYEFRCFCFSEGGRGVSGGLANGQASKQAGKQRDERKERERT